MRLLLIFLSLIFLAAALTYSCGTSSTKQPNLRDTTWVTVLYKVDPARGLYETGPARKYYKSVLKPDAKDSTKNIQTIDSVYEMAVFIPRFDTIRIDTAKYVIQKLDSTGLPMRLYLGDRVMKHQWIVKDFGKLNP